MNKYKVFTLKNVQAENFLMTPLELKEYIDFEVKRVYFVTSPQNGKMTGQHAHKQYEDEIFVQVQGSCTVVVDDGHGKEKIKLEGVKNAIYIPHMVWHGFENLSDDCIICALTSTNYDPSRSDYCEDYEEFKKMIVEN